MEKKTLVIICLAMCLPLMFAWAQADKKQFYDASKLYADSAYLAAADSYQGIDFNSEYRAKGVYNAANALYRADSVNKAIELLSAQAPNFDNPEDRANAFHNLGNAYLKSGKLKEAVEAYKNSLMEQPADEETRYNYTKAKKMLKQQEQQNKDEKKEEEKKEEKKDENKEENKDKKDEQEDKNSEEKKEEQSEEQQQQQEQQNEQQQKQQQANRQQAEQMLNALNQEEKEIQRKVKRQKGKTQKINIEKEW